MFRFAKYTQRKLRIFRGLLGRYTRGTKLLSGDSTVESFNFNGNQIQFLYEDYDSDNNYEVIVNTPIIFSEIAGGKNIVHMRIEDSIDKLIIDDKSGLFILPDSFPKQMQAIKKGYHVLAGLKASEYRKVLKLIGNGIIVLCPIKNEDSVEIKIV